MKGRWLKQEALDYLVGRPFRLSRFTGRPIWTPEEQELILECAAKIKSRKLRRGVTNLKRTFRDYSRVCKCRGSYYRRKRAKNLKGHGWIINSREHNPKYLERYYN